MTKRGSSFGYESSHVLRGGVSIGLFVRGSAYLFEGCSEYFCIFSFLYLLDTLFLYIGLVTT